MGHGQCLGGRTDVRTSGGVWQPQFAYRQAYGAAAASGTSVFNAYHSTWRAIWNSRQSAGRWVLMGIWAFWWSGEWVSALIGLPMEAAEVSWIPILKVHPSSKYNNSRHNIIIIINWWNNHIIFTYCCIDRFTSVTQDYRRSRTFEKCQVDFAYL